MNLIWIGQWHPYFLTDWSEGIQGFSLLLMLNKHRKDNNINVILCRDMPFLASLIVIHIRHAESSLTCPHFGAGLSYLFIYFLTICFTSISYYIKWRNWASRHIYEAVMNGCQNLTCVCQCKHHVSALSDLSSGQHYIVERHGRIHPVRVGRYLPGHHQPLQQKGCNQMCLTLFMEEHQTDHF